MTKIYPPKKLGGYTKMIPIYQLVEYTKTAFLFAIGDKEVREGTKFCSFRSWGHFLNAQKYMLDSVVKQLAFSFSGSFRLKQV